MADPRNYWNNRYSSGEPTRASGTFVHSEAANRWFYRAKHRRVRQILRDAGIDLKGKSVLDVACGTGAFIPLWLQLGATQVLGVDLSDKAAEACRQKFSRQPACKFDQADLASNEQKDLGQFDLVCIFEAIFLLTKEEEFMKGLGKLCSWVKPGGHLLISDHFPDATMERHERLTYHARSIYERAFARSGLEIRGLYRQSRCFNRHVFPEKLQSTVETLAPASIYWLNRILLAVSGNSSSYVDEVYYCLAQKTK